MRTREILVGTQEELTEYFCKFIESTRKLLKEENLLYSKPGIESQLEEIINTSKGIGLLYYIEASTNTPDLSDIDLVLKDCYVRVKH